MWPWEHVAFGYLCYSVYRNALYGSAPSDRAAVAVVVASVSPDLVDKPLSWSVGLFPAGYAIGHSVFTLAALAGVAVAFVVGYSSHLLGDVVYPVLRGGGLAPERVLWPLVTLPPYGDRLGPFSRSLVYLHRYVGAALSGEGSIAAAAGVGLVFLVGGLWVYDGAPGTWISRSTDTSPDRP